MQPQNYGEGGRRTRRPESSLDRDFEVNLGYMRSCLKSEREREERGVRGRLRINMPGTEHRTPNRPSENDRKGIKCHGRIESN